MSEVRQRLEKLSKSDSSLPKGSSETFASTRIGNREQVRQGGLVLQQNADLKEGRVSPTNLG